MSSAVVVVVVIVVAVVIVVVVVVVVFVVVATAATVYYSFKKFKDFGVISSRKSCKRSLSKICQVIRKREGDTGTLLISYVYTSSGK
jgi:hypothetical protein